MQLTPAPVERHPGRTLAEEANPILRLAAHLELGKRALAREDVETAHRHFSAASDLDPTDERPRAGLRGLGRLDTKKKRWFGLW